MSHFAVLVKIDPDTLQQHNGSIADAVDALLAPYQENNMGDCPKQYMQFYDKTQEIQEEFDNMDEEYKLKYPTLEDVAERYCGYKYDAEHMAYGYWENPNKKWDWYTIGGRWSNILPKCTENGVEMVDIVDRRDLDIATLDADDEQPVTLEQLQTEYRYFFKFSTWAVLDKDGWYTKGEMGWSGISDATPDVLKEFASNYMERFILNENPDTVLVIVDCHI